MSKKFPSKLKLGKCKEAVNLSKLNRHLDKARFVFIAVIYDSGGRRSGMDTFAHGALKFGDVDALLRAMEEHFGIVIPAVGFVLPMPKRECGYIA